MQIQNELLQHYKLYIVWKNKKFNFLCKIFIKIEKIKIINIIKIIINIKKN